MCFDVSIPIRVIWSTDGPLCLRSTTTSFWHIDAVGGRSLIASPLSTGFCLFLLPYRGHGSLRGRMDPPQHLVRSTGAAMSTAGSRGIHAAQGPPSQPPAPSPRRGNHHILGEAGMGLVEGFISRPPAARTSGMARPNTRCCAGSPTVSGQAPRALCHSPTASQSPAPSPSGLRFA
jgi:hypothetical protein